MTAIRQRWFLLTVLGACAAGFHVRAAKSELPTPPELNLALCASAPVLDGDLSDPCWGPGRRK